MADYLCVSLPSKYYECAASGGCNFNLLKKIMKRKNINIMSDKNREKNQKVEEKESVAAEAANESAEAANENKEVEQEPQKELSAEEIMEKRVAESEQKAAEAADKYVRLAAEFDNYRRRTAKERLELISTAGEDVIKGLLPVLDDCERALQVLKESKDSTAAIEGTELIYNKMMAFLKGKGLAVIEAKEKELDTEFHEAVAQFPVDDKAKKNKVIDVVQQGYTLNGKVIRYAKVVVGM